ncbi:PKD domain-containing protein [Phaeocystidibacter luteus]|uniref:T9SS type A sorting domain-containing protein n=1 Tax=Phaeocystidibacter luteus TaxID=911197 RepID=A0A6N6REZ7_9FLAO|nr:PKD domain-containing protein [Phaeocystidibacter luteus]KAB2805455.1 T9SS type A sorting domain-containing protein [Phaeocystidibacter luteus]
MKKTIILTLFFLLGVALSAQDSVHVSIRLEHPNSAPIGDYTVQVNDIGIDTNHTQGVFTWTDVNGEKTMDIMPMTTIGYIVVKAVDCQSNFYTSDTVFYNATSGKDTLNANLVLPCVDTCVGNAQVTQDNPNTFTFHYYGTGQWRPGSYVWNFSNHYSSSSDSVTRTFYSSPVYATLINKGCVIASDTLVVSVGNTGFGTAEFIVDTVNSFGGQVVLWNTSIDTSGSRADSSAFFWNFGDGNTSNLKFPTHQYSSGGPFQVSLTHSMYKNGFLVFEDTHVDTLGMDSTGQIIYKNGFLLRVLDPNGFSLEELTPDLVRIYPQPAGEWIQIEADREINSVELVDLNGRMLKKWTPNDSSVRLDVSSEMTGYYLVRIETESGIVVKKCILR